MKVQLDSQRLVQIRRARGLIQQAFADSIGISRRSAQRMESDSELVKLSHREFGRLAGVLRAYPHDFWATLPYSYDVYGILVETADQLERSILDIAAFTSFEVQHLPNDPEIEKSLVELLEAFEAHRETAGKLNQKNSEKLKFRSRVRDLFRITTDRNRIDKVDYYFMPCTWLQLAIPDNEEDPFFYWKARNRIIAVSAGTQAPVIKNHPTTQHGTPEGQSYEGNPIPPDFGNIGLCASEEEFILEALNARTDFTAGNLAEDDPFEDLRQEDIEEDFRDWQQSEYDDAATDALEASAEDDKAYDRYDD